MPGWIKTIGRKVCVICPSEKQLCVLQFSANDEALSIVANFGQINMTKFEAF